MKLTAKIISIIALLLTLTMVLTGCAALEDILDQILGGTDNPPANEDPSGYTISAENQDGLLYFSGSVTEGRFNGVYRDTFATLVNLTEVSGGYIIHFEDKEEKTQYIVMTDTTAGAALTEDKFEATIFEWNADLETYVVADDSNNRAFGVGKTSTYTTFSCYDVSKTTYNYGKFTPVNNPTIEKGEGGKPTGGNGGSQGGNTDNFGVIEAPVVGTAYKFGMVQGNLDNTIYYLAGGMDGYYMATTVNTADAIDVYIEETNGGYYLYCMVGGAKTYINFVVSGEHVNGAYEATASTVYRYDAESKTLIAQVDGADYWLATRNDKTYTTMGPCKTSYDGFYGQFYGVGGTTGGNQGGNEGGNQGGNEGGNQGGNTDSFGVIDTPVAGTAYKFGMVQGNLDNAIYYLAGGMDGYYMATTTDVNDAIDVYLEETNGGYHLYCMVGGKTYINFVVSGEHVNGAYEATASTVYRYDAESKTLIAQVDGADYWLATRNDKTYTTMGPCKTSYDGFYGQFYGVGGTTGGNQGGNEGGNQGGNTDSFGVIEAPVAGTAYKFGMVQGNLDNAIYYLAGGMDGYYMATTTDVNDAIDVYLEETNGGYHLYCMVGGKTYINFVVSGEHVNGAYEATASTVYRYDAESKTLIAQVDGADYWLATRNDKTYTTMGPCKTSYDGFYGQFYGVGGTTGGNQGGNEGGNQGGNEGGNQGGNTDSFGVIDTPVAGTAYKFGMVQGNLDNAIYYLAGGMDGYYMATTTDVNDAIDVYLEETNGGYHLYCMVGGKTYINFVVSGEHVNGAYEATASTVYRYDAESKTLIAQVDGADYWLATRNDKTYTTMGPCKTSYDGFYGQFYGVGGTTGGNQGGNEGGNQGGNESGNQGGNTGTNNPFEGGFELGLVPAYDSSFGGYYIINNNTPYFTADEIADAKAECFEYYAARDNLGRAIMAFACVCNNTRPNDTRGDISSVKPTGWVQKTYDNVPGGSLYNRSHLIAWSLTDEDANWENLVTGTEHMNQKVMTQFENQILSYIKANNSNKVLYRVTPIYNGNNLVCTGILLEAYSLNDNGEDICFCVFLYNVQPGISINYANGQSQKGDEAGQNSGLGTTSGGNTGNEGGNTGNEGGTTVTPEAGGSYYVHVTNGNGTLYLNGSITGGRFDGTYEKSEAAKVTVSTVEGGYLLSFGSQYIVIGDSSSGASVTNDPSLATVFEWNASLNTYVVAEDSNNRGFGADATVTKYNNVSTYDVSNTQYNWGVFTSVDGSTSTPDSGNQGGTTTPAHTCESVCDKCSGCTNATCNETVCANKCKGHETVDPNPGTGDAVELETYSHTMAKQDFTANGTATLSGLEWTLAGDGGYWGWDNNNVKGIQLGSKNAPYKTMTLTSASVSNVKKIVISTSGASSISGTLTVTVNGVQVGDTIKLTATNTEYTFELDEATTGEIVFTYTQTSSKAFYINTITIYTEK